MTQPIAIEVGISEDLKLRGHEWSVDGPPVLAVHDFGQDLDSWGGTLSAVAKAGFRVIAVELRGHGISDGEPDATTTTDDLVALVREVSRHWGPVGYLACGAAADAALYLDPDDGAQVQVMVSPTLTEEEVDWSTTTPAMRMIVLGSGDEETARTAKLLYRPMRGQKMWVSVGVPEQGTELLAVKPHLIEEITTFFARYLTGWHLAWIKEVSSGS